MVLIEMAIQRNINDGKEFTGGTAYPEKIMPRKNSYLWRLGQAWPVPADEDEYVMRIEAFGPELEFVRLHVPAGREVAGVVDWLPENAPSLSRLLRAKAKES